MLPWLLDICRRLLAPPLNRYRPHLLPRRLGRRSPCLMVGSRRAGRQTAVLLAHIAGEKMLRGPVPVERCRRTVHSHQNVMQSILQTGPCTIIPMGGPSDARREEPAQRADAPIGCTATPLDHPGRSIRRWDYARTPGSHHLRHSISFLCSPQPALRCCQPFSHTCQCCCHPQQTHAHTKPIHESKLTAPITACPQRKQHRASSMGPPPPPAETWLPWAKSFGPGPVRAVGDS